MNQVKRFICSCGLLLAGSASAELTGNVQFFGDCSEPVARESLTVQFTKVSDGNFSEIFREKVGEFGEFMIEEIGYRSNYEIKVFQNEKTLYQRKNEVDPDDYLTIKVECLPTINTDDTAKVEGKKKNA